MTRFSTATTPRVTRTNVPSQKSSVSQIVPRTVAAAYRPSVWNLPEALACNRRVTRWGNRAGNASRDGAAHETDELPASLICVNEFGRDCLTLNAPS